MTSIIVNQLSIYPVKSCGEIKLNSAVVESFGLANDRRWMIVDEKGIMLTQRKISEMCLLNVALADGGIILAKSSMDNLFVSTPVVSQKVRVKVWEDECLSYDTGNAAAKWLSAALSTPCRLVYFPKDEFRQVDLAYAHQGDNTAFSDGFPLLLISEASLDDLNARLTTPVVMSRFRPNIVVSGCPPFAEDNWKKIRIGDLIFRVVKACSRCVIPNINIETGIREREPIKTLATYRKRDRKIFFGQNVIADNFGEIKLGMTVEVLEE